MRGLIQIILFLNDHFGYYGENGFGGGRINVQWSEWGGLAPIIWARDATGLAQGGGDGEKWRDVSYFRV